MNKSKQCNYCKDLSTGMQFQPCYTCIDGSNFSPADKVIKLSKPKSLQKTYFIYWWKITKLIYRIFILERKLKPYSSLNKIKHQKYKAIRQTVKTWRSELKELKSQLKELI